MFRWTALVGGGRGSSNGFLPWLLGAAYKGTSLMGAHENPHAVVRTFNYTVLGCPASLGLTHCPTKMGHASTT